MTRRAEARWVEKEKRWRIRVQRNGESKVFYDTDPRINGKREAEKKADIWLKTGASGDILFSDLWDQYLRVCKETTGIENYTKHEQMGRLWLLPRLKYRRMTDITPLDWKNCINDGVKHGLSKKSCSNIRASIIAAVHFAQEMRLPAELPTIKIPKTAQSKGRSVLQPQALEMLFKRDSVSYKPGRHKKGDDAVERPVFYIYAYRFLVLTGIRCGELCGLKNEDIVGDHIYLKRSFNSKNVETRGKNENARRSFVIPKRARQVLVDQAVMLKKHGIISPWVFPTESGQQTKHSQIYKRWYVIREEFYGTKCSLHEMRHTMVSIAKTCVPDPLLKPSIGHSEHMDTHGTYSHEIDGDAELTAELIDKAFDRFLV